MSELLMCIFAMGLLFGIIIGMLLSLIFDRWSARLAAKIMKRLFPNG